MTVWFHSGLRLLPACLDLLLFSALGEHIKTRHARSQKRAKVRQISGPPQCREVRAQLLRTEGENECDVHCLDGKDVWSYLHGRQGMMLESAAKKVHFNVQQVI